MRVCFFDIETSNLKSNFAIMLTAAIKPLGEEPILFTKKKHGNNDKKLCKAVKDELEKYDIIIGYYHIPFDMRFLNSRLMHWGYPAVKPLHHIDCYRIAKKLFNTHSRRLEAITEFLHIKGKSRIEPEVWMDAAYSGDRKAINKIAIHNEFDVIILEDLFMNYLKPHVKSIGVL